MSPLNRIPILALGLTLVVGMACRKPEPVKVVEQPKVDTSAQDAARAKAAAEAEARRKAEAEAARKKAEQEQLEARRRAEAEVAKRTAYQQAAEKVLRDLHFDYNMSDLKEGDKALLLALADFLKAYPQALIQIEGHCDERGTVEYNMALGERRASATRAYLVALGVPEVRITTISYGKERPLCTENNEACWQRNRRAHFNLQK